MTRRPPPFALASARVTKAELSEAASLWHHIAQFGVLGKSLLKTTVLIVVEIGSDVSGECGRFKKFHYGDYTRIAYKSNSQISPWFAPSLLRSRTQKIPSFSRSFTTTFTTPLIAFFAEFGLKLSLMPVQTSSPSGVAVA